MYPSTQNHGNTSKRMVAVPCVPCCPLTAMSGRIINDPCLMARVEMLRVATSVRWKRWRSHLMLQGRPNLRCRSPPPSVWYVGATHDENDWNVWSSEAPKKIGILRKEKVKLAPHTRCRFSFADLIHDLSPLVNVVPGPALMAKE